MLERSMYPIIFIISLSISVSASLSRLSLISLSFVSPPRPRYDVSAVARSERKRTWPLLSLHRSGGFSFTWHRKPIPWNRSNGEEVTTHTEPARCRNNPWLSAHHRRHAQIDAYRLRVRIHTLALYPLLWRQGAQPASGLEDGRIYDLISRKVAMRGCGTHLASSCVRSRLTFII